MKVSVGATSSSETNLLLRGRSFTPEEIDLISELTRKHYDRGRSFISARVCEELNWRQPNGWLKDRACREVLVQLDARNLISLPPRKASGPIKGISATTGSVDIDRLCSNREPMNKLDLSSVRLVSVKGGKGEREWNALMDSFHYLGFKCFVGRSQKYIIYSNERILGCIGFCAPVWTLSARDNILKAIGFTIEDIRYVGINNGRFLILPWVAVPNLASFVLAMATKLVIQDWKAYYSIKPRFLETFVDPTRYLGTCYTAANWIHMGQTAGYSKCGRLHHNSKSPKEVFIYPIERKLRQNINLLLKGSIANFN